MAAAPGGVNRFYVVLGVVAVIGLGLLAWMMSRPASVSIPANVVVQASDTAGFRGYVLGSADAPVEITEYADYQCPACQDFEVVQFPSVRSQLIETGQVRWRYRDFPLDAIHPHARLAAHAAACGDEQGKFWELHAAIYEGQAEWSRAGNATSIFRRYAEQVGLDMAEYDACMTSGRYAGRIQASLDEGRAVGVGSTPTFLIGGRLYPGRLSSDQIRRIADSLAALAPAAATPVPADSQ